MKYQITCPVCHHEWHYDNGYLDDNITRLGIEIKEITLQLHEHKSLPKSEQYANTKWWLSAKKALTMKQKQLAELKAFRKMNDQQVKAYQLLMWKELFKEEYGDEAYKKMIEKVEKELEAYTTSGLMRHEYTRSPHKSNVTSINKL
jgi:hypothetical protein